MQKTIKKYHYPQQFIGEAVTNAVKLIYSLEWESLRVVRQTKHRGFGTLKFVDYAVPCFELAKLAKVSPSQIAQVLAEELQKSNHDQFLVEAVAGFLNFQLDEAYLKNSLKATSRWFSSPVLLTNKNDSNFLILGATLPASEDLGLADIFYQYTYSLGALLGMRHAAQYIVSDNSEATLSYLTSLRVAAPAGAGRRTDILEAQKTRVGVVTKKWLQGYNQFVAKQQIADCAVVTESSIEAEVQSYLDAMPGDLQTDGIIHDVATGATYYLESDEATPLRAVSGLLYRMAFVLYLMEEKLKVLPNSQQLVVVASQNLHPLLYSRAKALRDAGKTKATIVCYDPVVSRADIMEIQELIPSLADHFVVLAKATAADDTDNLHDATRRAAILALVDAPLEFSQYATQNKLPALFDTLNQTSQVIRQLTG